MADHPMQPVEFDGEGTPRFKANKIVRYLQEFASEKGMDLNQLAKMPFPEEDWEQFAQLIGYSVSGFGDLSYVRTSRIEKADKAANALRKKRRKQ